MAQRHPGKSRKSRENQPNEDDAFVAGVFELSTWAKANSQVLILFAVAVGLMIAGSLYYVNYRERMTTMAVQELEAIQALVAGGQDDAAKTRLAQYLERFDGSPLEPEARMHLADLHLQTGDAGLAVSVLEGSDAQASDPLGPQVLVMRARALEEMGRLDEAEALYLRVGEGAELEFQRREALEDAARIRMMLGNPAGAAELYRRLLEGMENDADRGRIEMRLAEAETRAST